MFLISGEVGCGSRKMSLAMQNHMVKASEDRLLLHTDGSLRRRPLRVCVLFGRGGGEEDNQ